jgi:nuclear transport factor 2 (NTF2) superfamily protein
MTQPLVLPFTASTARAQVQGAKDAWNTRNPNVVALGCCEGAEWRDRDAFIRGREAIKVFLSAKWARQLHYRLEQELWAYTGNRIALRLTYEWQHARTGQWYRSHGNEHWEFDDEGLLRRRDMSANDIPIEAGDRRIGFEPHQPTRNE